MEIVFAVAVLTTVLYNGAKAVMEDVGDIKYAAKGKDHPRWAYRQAKLEAARKGEPTGYWQVLAARAWDKAFAKRAKAVAAEAARPPKGPRPLRDYFGKCWADAWKTEEERHDRRVEARRQKRTAKQADGFKAPIDTELVPEPLEVPESVEDAEPIPAVVHEHPSQIPFQAEFAEALDEKAKQSSVPTDAAGRPVWSPTGPTPDELERLKLARRRARAYLYGEGLDTVDRKPDSDDASVLLNGLTGDDKALADEILKPHPELDRIWDAEQQRRFRSNLQTITRMNRDMDERVPRKEHARTNDQPTEVPDNVIPFNKPLPTPKEIEPMTTATTEIDGLESAIAWASDVKTNAAEMASGIDDVEGDFAARKVSGETLTLVGQIGEAYDELRELAAQLEEKLQAMQSVAEAYEAAPDTGDKEFVTS